MTAIIDYRAGNLTSVRNAFASIGAEATVTSDPAVIAAASCVVFPGVGAAKSAMRSLADLGLADTVRKAAAEKPFLGICLGMQILFTHTEEDGGVDTLGILPGRVRRFPDVPGFKVPEMGWNQVKGSDPLGLLKPAEYFYFVHSYYVEMNPAAVGRTEYAGITFASAVRRGNLFATQFHPEKSGSAGLALLREFLRTTSDAEGGRTC